MIISLEHVTVQYEQTLVLKNVSFEVHEGDYLCIVGDNGSGKSSLVKCLLALIKPKAGQIRYGISPEEIGYLPQMKAHGNFPASVKEVVLSGCLKGWRLFYTAEE
jgi:zinc transport system ATP-binding protein